MLPTADIHCPYCGESIEVIVDDSAGDQRYIEDCQVCCRPITVVSVDRRRRRTAGRRVRRRRGVIHVRRSPRRRAVASTPTPLRVRS